MDSSTATRIRPCFTEEDDGLASLAEPAGFSGNPNHHPHPHPPFFFSRPLYFNTLSHRKNSLRNLSSSSSPRSGSKYYFEEVVHQQPHFLEACALCKKPLGDNKDIFMYRGDTPFCSEECREEQIEIDEAKEKKWNLSASSMTALRKDQKKKSKSTSPNKAQDYPFRTGTVAAA